LGLLEGYLRYQKDAVRQLCLVSSSQPGRTLQRNAAVFYRQDLLWGEPFYSQAHSPHFLEPLGQQAAEAPHSHADPCLARL